MTPDHFPAALRIQLQPILQGPHSPLRTAPFTQASSGICPQHSNNIQSAPSMKSSQTRDPKVTIMHAPGSQ